MSATESRQPECDLTGQALIAALQACPDRNVALAPAGGPMPVRDVHLTGEDDQRSVRI